MLFYEIIWQFIYSVVIAYNFNLICIRVWYILNLNENISKITFYITIDVSEQYN